MEQYITMYYRTSCYNCRKDANQMIIAVPNGARVVCDNCRDTRSFVPVVEDIGRKGDFSNHAVMIYGNFCPQRYAGIAE